MIQTKNLLSAVTKAAKCSEKKDDSMITSHLLLECKNNKLTVTGTDFEISYQIEIDYDNADFISTVNAKDILDALKNNKDSKIIFEVEDINLVIKIDDTGSIKSPSFDTKEYPKNGLDGVTIKEFDTTGLYAVNPAADRNNFQWELNGALINHEAIVTTDTKRMAAYPFDALKDTNLSVILPKKAIEILKACKFDIATVKIGTNLMSFENDKNEKITSQLINARFPDYHRIIPKSLIFKLKLKREFLEYLKKVSNSEVKMQYSNNELMLYSLEPDGKPTKTVKIPPDIYLHNFDDGVYKNSGFEIAFNAKYVNEAFLGDTALMGFNGANMPFIVNSGALHTVIMPIFL